MYLDLEYKIRTDSDFRNQLQRHQKRMEELDRLSQRNSAFVDSFHQALFDFIKYCSFNLALLTSYFWPRYPKDRHAFSG